MDGLAERCLIRFLFSSYSQNLRVLTRHQPFPDTSLIFS